MPKTSTFLIRRAPRACLGLCASLLCAGVPTLSAQPLRPGVAQLKTLSLEELMAIEVTTATRYEERIREVPAAVHVITEEDIRRSGAKSLPEALRLAPNLQVAQGTARTWAISARGFNASFSNKLLVLIDGRRVYSPLFSGVFWDAQDTLLEDIERIEVISGPGAVAWGANAVNGVINIVTKAASDTQGALVRAGVGTEERGQGAFRYGGTLGADLHYRVYAKGYARDGAVLPDGRAAADGSFSGQAGFRMDRSRLAGGSLTVQGDIYDGRREEQTGPDAVQSGGNLLARWTRRFTSTERLRLQAYFDRTHQFVPGEFGDTLHTVDADVQYERNAGRRHHLMFGSEYRLTRDRVENLPGSIAFLPPSLTRHLISVFVQDQISLTPRLKVSAGSRFEHNYYTGLEIQPSARMVWTAGRHVVWSAVSRAVRMPSRFDRDLYFPAAPPFVFAGGPDFDSEELIAYEVGWRAQPARRVLLSVVAFYSDYDDVRSSSPEAPFVNENNVEGEIGGLELAATWQVRDTWRITGGYTRLAEAFRVKPGRADLFGAQGETFDPPHAAQLRSALTLPHAVELDGWLRYVDRIPGARGFEPVPAYVTLDARVGWSPHPRLELAVVGQNLFERLHREFGPRQIERSGSARAIWRF